MGGHHHHLDAVLYSRYWSSNICGDCSTPAPFVYPADGQKLAYNDAFFFRVKSVDGASGYLYGFFQDGSAVWRIIIMNIHFLVSSTEFFRAPAHNAIHPGTLEVWVRALVNGEWTDATIINVTLEQATGEGTANNNYRSSASLGRTAPAMELGM
jgi:hypothetical protein